MQLGGARSARLKDVYAWKGKPARKERGYIGIKSDITRDFYQKNIEKNMIFAGFRKYATPQELRYGKRISLGPSDRVQRPRGRLEGIMDLRTVLTECAAGGLLGYEMKRDETAKHDMSILKDFRSTSPRCHVSSIKPPTVLKKISCAWKITISGFT